MSEKRETRVEERRSPELISQSGDEKHKGAFTSLSADRVLTTLRNE